MKNIIYKNIPKNFFLSKLQNLKIEINNNKVARSYSKNLKNIAAHGNSNVYKYDPKRIYKIVGASVYNCVTYWLAFLYIISCILS